MYGNVWSNMSKLWWHVALWSIHVSGVWKVALSFSNLNFSHVEHVLPHITKLYQKAIMQHVSITSKHYHMHYHRCYCTVSLSLTWIGHNWTCYHNFTICYHTCFHTFPLNLALFGGYLQQVTTCYHQFFKKILMYIFFINLSAMHGNLFQIAPKSCYTERKCMVTHVVTHWSYDNAFHYGWRSNALEKYKTFWTLDGGTMFLKNKLVTFLSCFDEILFMHQVALSFSVAFWEFFN